ncbi:MAG: hypothetical protein JSW46_19610 [Gemmatimonadota bacterium]|nr:MAG: hypothetical protein JSW46_19610 [Gemmatimonadota bacterium]
MDKSPVPSEADLHLMYQIAHHDIWWAKTQVWTTTNWALALLGAIVGIGALAYKPEGMVLSDTWHLVALSFVVALAGAAYLARLHYDLVRARRVTLALRQQRPELDALVSGLPIIGKGGSVATRGVWFTVVLLTILALGLGIATYLLGRETALSVVATLDQLVLSNAFLAMAAKKGAA